MAPTSELPPLPVDHHLRALEREGECLADVAEVVGLDAEVPTCPGWTIAELVRHTGAVHRWATDVVANSRGELPPALGDPGVTGSFPVDAELIGWFREGHAALVGALRAAPDDLDCARFLPAPSPRAFWARRQAHETSIHRADAESATGEITPFDPRQAADGIDELVRGFASRRSGKLRSDVARTLAVWPTDADTRWRLHITSEPLVVTFDGEPADVEVRATASDLYLALWNRVDLSRLAVSGDPAVLALWPDAVQIRWA